MPCKHCTARGKNFTRRWVQETYKEAICGPEIWHMVCCSIVSNKPATRVSHGVRTGCSRKSSLLAVLVVAAAIPVSYRAYTCLTRSFYQKHANEEADHVKNSPAPEALLALANHFYWLNNGARAGPLYGKAEALFVQRGDTRNELYAKIGRLRSDAETMSFADLSRFLADQLRNPVVVNDPELRLWCLGAKAYTDIEIDYQAEKQDWLELQQIAKSLGEERWVTRSKGELGLIAYLEGNSTRAAKLLGTALVSTMTNGDTGGQIRFLEMLGDGMEEVNRHNEALMFFDRAINLAQSDKDCGVPFMALEGKAQALIAIGKPEQADKVLRVALAQARSLHKQGHTAQLLIVMAKLATRQGNKQQAIADLEEAGRLATRVHFYRIEADAMFELAKLYRDLGDLATADTRATQGLAASQRVGDRYYVPRNLTVLADLKARQGHVAEAEDLYQQAEDVIDGMLGQADSYWDSSIAAAMSETYLQHFELLSKQGDTARAFQVVERVRGRTLATALTDGRANSQSENNEATTADRYVSNVQLKLMQSNNPVERQYLLDELAEYEWRSRLAWNQGGKSFPIKPAPLTQIQGSLQPDEVLLEYVLDEPTSFCAVISPTTAIIKMLPSGGEEIRRLVQDYVNEVRGKRSGAGQAKKLYQVLIQPIFELVTAKRFIIVPDDVLNLLPFDALKNSDGRYLLQSHIISYAPSATVLDALRRRHEEQVPSRPFLGLGDVAYENQGGVGHRMSPPDTLRGSFVRGLADFAGVPLHDLPQTRQELQTIGKIVGKNAEILLGTTATESAFKREPLSQFRVLHLAVHGFADPQYPERSALVLGADPKAGEDGLLQVREIKRLRINAELTTLSACDGGIGKLQGEAGVSDLAEAFLAAGSKAVVASLWSADDTFAGALMERFYQHLVQGENAGTALRGAKLDLLAEYGDQVTPFYWAAFVAIGDASRPIRITEQ